MESIKLKIALMVLQEEQPKNWKVQLQYAKNRIAKTRREMHLGNKPQDIADAMTQCIVRANCPVNYLMAGAYIINRKQELLSEHHSLEMRSERIRNQLKRLNAMNWLQRDKILLNCFYTNFLKAIQLKIDNILKENNLLNSFSGPLKNDTGANAPGHGYKA